MWFGALMIYFDQNRSKGAFQLAKVLVNGHANLQSQLQHNQKDDNQCSHDVNLGILV